MAKKPCNRNQKETGNHSRKQEAPSDEITLRDEILDLKRQVMILKRTNEQYSVRLRKYEDESKRKDRQFEQLMNPRKNAGITKVLSTKGAAILMNLKDQNNALLQMLLNKDLHIRRLVAEVKMSKLYASTKRNECYKAEIGRLRNLLIKSEEMLKENDEVQQEQTRSICVSGNPISEFSSSSDQSSSRDLDELRCTILSLESHIKYSNDLLAQKNHEISVLSEELNVLKNRLRYKASKSEVFDRDNSTPIQLSTKTFMRSYTDTFNSQQLSSQDLLNFFEKSPNNEYGHLSYSAPAGSTTLVPSYSSTPEHRLPVSVTVSRSTPAMGKSLFHNLAADEILKAEKMLSRARRPLHTKGKWKQALTKYKELKKLNPLLTIGGDQNRKPFAESEMSSKLDLKTQESEIMEKDIQGWVGAASPTNEEKTFKSVELKSEQSVEKTEGLGSTIKNYEFSTGNNDVNDNDVTLDSCQSCENSSISNKSIKCSTVELVPSNESEHTHKDLNMGLNGSPHAQKELKTSLQNDSEELKPKERKSLREVYCQSLDSSFDSENSYSAKQEVWQVQVEVQINSVSLENHTDQLETTQSCEMIEENGGNHAHDFEVNDDDDVIVR